MDGLSVKLIIIMPEARAKNNMYEIIMVAVDNISGFLKFNSKYSFSIVVSNFFSSHNALISKIDQIKIVNKKRREYILIA